MKKELTSGFVIVVILLLGYIFFLRECGKKTTVCPPKGYILLLQQVKDSLDSIANLPPKIDTVHEKGKTVYIEHTVFKPMPEPGDSTINNYEDSIVKKDTIDVHIKLKVKGTLEKLQWSFKPITTKIVIERYVPKLIDNPVPTPKNGFYISVLGGGNKETFLFGGNLDLITKKNTVVGIIYQRWGKDNIYEFKLGTKISFKGR
jgi:hypothetical protein